MKIALSDLWRSDGAVGRGPYAFLGCVLFAFKHNLDRLVATAVFGRPWNIFSYLQVPLDAPGSSAFYATLIAIALPFVWTGVALTVRRLRDLRWPTVLCLLFFLPFLNLAFFVVLSLAPRSQRPSGPPVDPRWLGRLIPREKAGAAAVGVLLTALAGLMLVVFSAWVLRDYGGSLFVGVPFMLGFVATLLYGYHEPRSYRSCMAVAASATTLLGLSLIACAIEGVVCIAMATPLAIPLAWFGASIAYLLQARRPSPVAARTAVLIVLGVAPLLMGAESASRKLPAQVEVLSSVDISAPPEVVWMSVVEFPEIPPPREWIFRSGIAYPVRATIDGRGVGAVRHCVFTTGAFVEPITRWDEPHVLAFDVARQPEPMIEWAPYRGLEPPHLDGYLRSERGEFRLVPLVDGRTRLEGRTWYRVRMWPAAYWQTWSDAIIHRIHMRVLEHIRRRAET